MSIATEIQRLQSAKANIKSAIEQKGVTVGNGTIDTYAQLISEISGGGSNVGYKTTEVEITSSVTNAQELFSAVFNGANLEHYCVAYLSQPKNTDYIYNQITFLYVANGVKQGIRYRDGVYAKIDIATNYDAAVTIGDVYTVVDLDEYVEDKDYEQGFEDGKNSVVQLDRYLKTATFTNLNIFGKKEVELNFDNLDNLMNLFSISKAEDTNITVEHLTINMLKNPTTLLGMLYCSTTAHDYTLKHLTLNFSTENCNRYSNAFGGLRALETIDGQPLDFSSVVNASYLNAFSNNGALVDVRFVKNSIGLSISFTSSPNLSTDTIQSIIDGLATVGTAQTLTLHANVKILQSQVDTANAKGWTIAGGIVVSEVEYYA